MVAECEVVFDVVDLAVVSLELEVEVLWHEVEVVLCDVLEVVGLPVGHFEHEASTVSLSGEQTSNGTWASAQM